MKNLNYLFLLVFGSMLVGCNDFLDVAPDERLSIDELDKVEATVIGSYQNDRSVRFTHMSSDDVTLAKFVYASDIIIDDLYTWSRDFSNPTHQDAPGSYWVASYGSISQINHALEALNNLDLIESEQNRANAVKGEALVMRSYCHFMLVNLFAKHYDATTADSDLGVPYVFLPEKKLIASYTRESVEKVYQLAEKDLLDGLDLMKGNLEFVNKNKYRFTLQTAYNYASRFYTYRNKNAEDVEKAINYGELAISAYGGIQEMRPWNDYTKDFKGPVDIDRGEVGLVQSSRTWMVYGFKYQCTTDIRDTKYLNNPFGLEDNRFKTWYQRGGNVFMPAFYFIGEGESSATDLFPIAEAIFNTAEAYVRQGNYVKAKELMTVVASNVYSGYISDYLSTSNLKGFYDTSKDKTAWTNYLLFERRNHFLMKGMRWFDIKRYNINVKHILSSGEIIWLTQVAPDKDYQIPSFAIDAGMKPNK